MRPARPKIDSVDRIACGLNADEARRYFHVRFAGFALDYIQRFQRDQFGPFDARARWRA